MMKLPLSHQRPSLVKVTKAPKKLEEQKQKQNITPLPREPLQFTPSFPIAGPADKAGMSGHKFAAENIPSTKVKSKGIADPETVTSEMKGLDITNPESEEANLLDALPSEFKVGRKHLKVVTYPTSYAACTHPFAHIIPRYGSASSSHRTMVVKKRTCLMSQSVVRSAGMSSRRR